MLGVHVTPVQIWAGPPPRSSRLVSVPLQPRITGFFHAAEVLAYAPAQRLGKAVGIEQAGHQRCRGQRHSVIRAVSEDCADAVPVIDGNQEAEEEQPQRRESQEELFSGPYPKVVRLRGDRYHSGSGAFDRQPRNDQGRQEQNGTAGFY